MPDAGLWSPAVLQRAVAATGTAITRAGPAAVPPPPRSHTPIHWTLAGMVGAQGADVVTTVAALQRGGTEVNPLYGPRPSLGRVVATKAAFTVPTVWILDRLYQSHPRLAVSLAILVGAVSGGVAVQNSRQGRISHGPHH